MAILVGQFLFKFTSGKDNKKKTSTDFGRSCPDQLPYFYYAQPQIYLAGIKFFVSHYDTGMDKKWIE